MIQLKKKYNDEENYVSSNREFSQQWEVLQKKQ